MSNNIREFVIRVWYGDPRILCGGAYNIEKSLGRTQKVVPVEDGFTVEFDRDRGPEQIRDGFRG